MGTKQSFHTTAEFPEDVGVIGDNNHSINILNLAKGMLAFDLGFSEFIVSSWHLRLFYLLDRKALRLRDA